MLAEVRILIFTLILYLSLNLKAYADIEYECLTETAVSGLFQSQRKFLKDSEFFPYKTIMSFNENYTQLTVKDSTYKKAVEAKYKFNCTKESNKPILNCGSTGSTNPRRIKFSLETLRYRKSVTSDYWIEGQGNEIDYIHISHGYCYSLTN